jgi:hypothetical protein
MVIIEHEEAEVHRSNQPSIVEQTMNEALHKLNGGSIQLSYQPFFMFSISTLHVFAIPLE